MTEVPGNKDCRPATNVDSWLMNCVLVVLVMTMTTELLLVMASQTTSEVAVAFWAWTGGV